MAADGLDHFADVFGDLMGDGVTWYSFDQGDFHFVMLDSSDLESGMPSISEPQWEWLEADLAATEGMRTWLVLHHAVTEEATIIFSLWPDDQEPLLAMLEERDDVIGVLSGHSHRAKVTTAPGIDAPFVETVSTKEYPGSYVLYDVHSDGYVQTTWRAHCAECLEWYEMTKEEYNGNAYEWQFGELADRNFVHSFDPLPAPETEEEPVEEATGCGACATATETGGGCMGLAAARGRVSWSESPVGRACEVVGGRPPRSNPIAPTISRYARSLLIQIWRLISRSSALF